MSISKNTIVLSFLLTSLSFGPVLADDRNLDQKLDSVISNYLPKGVSASVYVYDLTADSALFDFRGTEMCRPASTEKVITTVTALMSLGKDYKFQTKLTSQGKVEDGVLDGDLFLVGGLDPGLQESDLRRMVQDLKNAGITRIDGNVYADISMMDSIPWGSGWCWDDAPSSFQPYISPLMIHEGYVAVDVRPTENGKAPQVSLSPSIKNVRIDNRARTGVKSLGALQITRDVLRNDNTIIVTGNCTQRQVKEITLPNSAEMAFTFFLGCLDEAGIRYSGSGWKASPVVVNKLSVVERSIQDVVREALKESNNLYAEALFLQTGRLSVPSKVTYSDAAKFVSNFVIRKIGVTQQDFNIVDGCGLSMYDYVSPRTMVDFLKLAYSDEEIYNIFYKSLPASGIDGTLKSRLGSQQTINRIHAKTGSVTGACTLAGYLTDSRGHNIAFCIMNGGAIKMAPSRRFQDTFCEVLYGM